MILIILIIIIIIIIIVISEIFCLKLDKQNWWNELDSKITIIR